MIGADRRGVIAGSEEARERLQREMPENEIRSFARRVLAKMRDGGYAHLDPEQDFISGFVAGYQQFFLISQVTV